MKRIIAGLLLLALGVGVFACSDPTESQPRQPGQCYDLPEGRACE